MQRLRTHPGGDSDNIPAFPKIDRAKKPSKNWLTREEQLRVIKELPEKSRLPLLFIAYHGKRINEALSLKWEDIDLKRRVFRVYESKISNEKWLPFHDAFVKALPIAGTINKTGKLFDLNFQLLNRHLKIACQKAGVQEVTTHEFGITLSSVRDWQKD